MTPYPADAIEAALKALLEDEDWQQYGWATADMSRALAAFDAAMWEKGWKLCPREPSAAMVDAAPLSNHTPTWCWRATRWSGSAVSLTALRASA